MHLKSIDNRTNQMSYIINLSPIVISLLAVLKQFCSELSLYCLLNLSASLSCSSSLFWMMLARGLPRWERASRLAHHVCYFFNVLLCPLFFSPGVWVWILKLIVSLPGFSLEINNNLLV